MEPQILTGEAPDPTRIPTGCRFHPRCPLVASGEAERLGIEARCRGEDLGLSRRGRRRARLAAQRRLPRRPVRRRARAAVRARGGRSVRVTTRLTYTSGGSDAGDRPPRSSPRSPRCATGRRSRSPTSSAASARSRGRRSSAATRAAPTTSRAARTRRRRARRGRGRARPRGAARVAAHAGGRALRAAAPGLRGDLRAPHGAGGRGDAGDRQEPHRVDRRGPGGRRPDRGVLRADRAARRLLDPARAALARGDEPAACCGRSACSA